MNTCWYQVVVVLENVVVVVVVASRVYLAVSFRRCTTTRQMFALSFRSSATRHQKVLHHTYMERLCYPCYSYTCVLERRAYQSFCQVCSISTKFFVVMNTPSLDMLSAGSWKLKLKLCVSDKMCESTAT